MRQRDKQAPQSAEETVRDIWRATRRHFSAEEKIRIVLDGLLGEGSIAELCHKEGIADPLLPLAKELLEAGKKRLAGDTAREASSDEVKQFRTEARQLKESLAEVTLENRLLKDGPKPLLAQPLKCPENRDDGQAFRSFKRFAWSSFKPPYSRRHL